MPYVKMVHNNSVLLLFLYLSIFIQMLFVWYTRYCRIGLYIGVKYTLIASILAFFQNIWHWGEVSDPRKQIKERVGCL